MHLQHIIQALDRGTDVTGPPVREEFGRLFRANHVSIHRCDTFAYDAAGRLEYLRELVGKYGLVHVLLPRGGQCVFLSATFAKRPESLITFMRRAALSALATESDIVALLFKMYQELTSK